MNSIVLVPECFFRPWDKRPSSLHIELVHTGSSILTRSLFPNPPPVFLQWMWFAIGSTVICFFLGVYARKLIWAYVQFYYFYRFQWKKIRCIFESGHLVDSLVAWFGVIIVCAGSFHSDATFWCFSNLWDHIGLRFWCIRFYCPTFHFWKFPFFLV